MHILLTNDDGFDSELLHLLCRTVAARGHQVTVSAPECQQSAKGHAFTLFDPIRVRPDVMEGAEHAWRVEGTPVDSLRIGLKALAETPVDLTISGINHGWNIGLATYVSGTVGAARESAFLGYPSMALSMEPGTPAETVQVVAEWAIRLAEKLPKAGLPKNTLVNLNIPRCNVMHLRGAKLCPISTVCYDDGYERRVSPRGTIYFWNTPEVHVTQPDPGSDTALLRENYITVSLLSPRPLDEQAWGSLLDEL